MNNESEKNAQPETRLVAIEDMPRALSAAEEVALTQERAQAVVAIIDGAKAYAVIQGKKYLQVESWQVIGNFDGVGAATEWVKPIELNGEVVAYEAKVNLIDRNGIIKRSAIMTCGMDEHVAQGKKGWMQHVAIQSMAQTRAESKAYRMNYAAVALLAGFEGTTAEEMQTGSSAPRTEQQQDDAPFCAKHNVSFRKNTSRDGSRSWYSHPETSEPRGWCNQDKSPVPEKTNGDADRTLRPPQPHPDLPRQAPVDPNLGEQPPDDPTDELRI